MRSFTFCLFLAPLLLHAKETDLKRLPQIFNVSSEIDEQLSEGDCIYEFEFQTGGDFEKPISVYYSIDGITSEVAPENNVITIKSTPGKHIFQFYYSENYHEVYSDSIEILSRHRDRYWVQLDAAVYDEKREKPVIYLYPQSATDVTVQLAIHGENAFMYPAYNDSWKFTALPSGDLIFGDNTYNYLFWESTQRTIISPKQTATGFFVEGKNAVHFLEEKLTKAGLNSKEQADFITFWGPRLAKNKLNFVHFEFNETCENLDMGSLQKM